LAALAVRYLYRRLGWRKPRGGWSPLLAMSLIGAASGCLFALDQHWVYTSRIAEIAYGEFVVTPVSLIPLAALIGAMVLAAITGGQFQLRRGTLSEWLAASAGGLLMGLGATLVPGGNDTMLFTGVPLLLPNLIAAYAAFVATLLVTLRAREPKPPPAT
jgi:cytochrome bd-type quinol oxidase subunit 2